MSTKHVMSECPTILTITKMFMEQANVIGFFNNVLMQCSICQSTKHLTKLSIKDFFFFYYKNPYIGIREFLATLVFCLYKHK